MIFEINRAKGILPVCCKMDPKTVSLATSAHERDKSLL